nr:60S ribosomal protein L34 [Tanacetum cinerariifolium]
MHFTVNFHHDGNFVPSPLMYQEGDESIINDIDFEGMTVARLSKMLQGTCMFPVKGIFFLVPGKELSNGLIHIKNDLDLANCIAIGYKNGKLMGVIYPAFDPKLPWNEMKPTLGLRFEHPEQLKDCLTNYGVANGYQLWYRRNDYRSLFVLCGKDLAEGKSGGKKGKKGDWPYKKEKDEDELPKKDKGKLLRAPKKGTQTAGVELSLKWTEVVQLMKMVFLNLITIPLELLEDLSGVLCVHYVAAFSFLKNDPILGVSAWYSKKMWQNAYSYFIKPVDGSSMWSQTPEEPPLPPVLRKMSDGGDADPSSAGPCVGDPSFAGPSVADPSSAGPSVVDSSSVGPSVADSTGSGTQTITEDPIVADPTNDILTQQSKTSD